MTLGGSFLGRALAHMALGLGHERSYYLTLLVSLGMPLNTEHEAPIRQLDRLGEAVHSRATADLESLAEAIDALVMMGLGRVVSLSGRARSKRAIDQVDVMVGAVESARKPQMFVMAEMLGQVL